MNPAFEIQATASCAAVACSVLGVFLVLRRSAMLSDAISHSVLPGIIISFLLGASLGSPWLILGATLSGFLAAMLVYVLQRSRLLTDDASIGLIFPVMFSIGILLISRYAANTHIDSDSVLLGELALVPLERVQAFGYDFGPRSLLLAAGVLLVNSGLVFVFFKELAITTFDAQLAKSMGISPRLLHLGLVVAVSWTCVVSFESVGTVLSVVFFIVPAVAARMYTMRLAPMLWLAAGIGLGCSVLGYWLARWLDASVAGSMATVAGVALGLSWMFAPRTGLVSQQWQRRNQGVRFLAKMLIVHVRTHEDQAEAKIENTLAHLVAHLGWTAEQSREAVAHAADAGWIGNSREPLTLTHLGRAEADTIIAHTGLMPKPANPSNLSPPLDSLGTTV